MMFPNFRRHWTLLLLFFLLLPPSRAAGEWSPVIHHATGPGGLTVLLSESRALPMVEVRILMRAGSAYDPKGKEGVAALTAWMFNEGGGDLDAIAFREQLDFYGIDLSASVKRETMLVKMTTLSTHLDQAWGLLADALLRPRFDDREFQRAKTEQTASLTKNREKPEVMAGHALMRMIYGDHPYAHPASGMVETIKNIQVSDIKKFFSDGVRSPGMVLAVAGDVSQERLQGLIQKHLAGLNSEPGPFQAIPALKTAATGGIQQISMDIPQTTLRLGVMAVDRHDPDYYALYVMNQILGGSGMTSRLTNEIREKRGLAYGVFSYFSPLPGRGPFVIGTKTKTGSAQEVLDLIYQEIRRMAEKGVSEAELREVKRYLVGSFPLHFDSLDSLAATWAVIGFYQRGLDYLEKWTDRISAVTPEDIRRVAGRILRVVDFQVASAGKHGPLIFNRTVLRDSPGVAEKK